MSGLTVAVVGATGAVGREMWRLVASGALPVSRAIPYTSARSAGTELAFRGTMMHAIALSSDTFEAVDLALFSAGASVAREWAPRFMSAGSVVVDNSSAFRKDPDVPLVVPELNGEALEPGVRLVANPNCSTIQMVMALAPLHRAWGLRSVKVATYQSASGAGSRALAELMEGTRQHLEGGVETPNIFPHPLAFNVIPQVGEIDATGESIEERKMRDETRRILGLPDLPVSATCVRVPVLRSHSEAVWASFDEIPDPRRAASLLQEMGVVVEDDPKTSRYPLPRHAAGRPEVFVGRLRSDPSDPHGLAFWVVSDNLLKGAATNAVQVAEALLARGLLVRSVS
jgi:aspartate-semialdehyde dehydrogenase